MRAQRSLAKDFPGSPVVRTLHFTAQGPGQCLVGELRSHKPCCAAGKKNKPRDFSRGPVALSLRAGQCRVPRFNP